MKRLLLVLKGMAMGGADVIPGVSGGTIALIAGIYEELIASIKVIDGASLRLLIAFEFKTFWIRINGSFLLSVFAGILISIFSLARLITYLLENHPIPVWSFFFGLILISSFYVMPRTNAGKTLIWLIGGAIVAFLVTSLSPAQTPTALWFIFLSGTIAICAMILPGISGSFILLLLGKYEYVLDAVKSLDLMVIFVFGLGCLIGIISFSKFIHWLLSRYKNATLAVLAGFMLGSLNKVWPWKQTVDEVFINLSPSRYEQIIGEPSMLPISIVFCLVGILLVVGLEWIGKKLVQ